MDFLRIRQKAKERVARGATPAPPRAAAPTAPPVAAVPAPAAEEPPIEEELRAELAAVRVAAAAPPAPAARPGPAPDPLDEFFWSEEELAPGIAEMGPVAARGLEPPAEVRREWIAFHLGAEEYAVEIGNVREILKPPAITEVPRAPAHVLGVIMVRGEVIAVFDPRRRLGLPPAAPGRATRVLVCDAGDGARGLLVDAVSGVVRLPASAVEARPNGIGAASAEYIAGIGRDGERLLVLLDAAAVLRDASAAAPAALPTRGEERRA